MRIPDWSGISCALILATALVACGKVSHKTADVGEMSRHTIEHQGLEREYFVYLPPGYEAAAVFPVVFFLHGYGGSATGVEAETTNGLKRYAADNTVQIFGGMGLMEDLPVERLWRDARIERIWDGTSEIQRHIISRTLLRPFES